MLINESRILSMRIGLIKMYISAANTIASNIRTQGMQWMEVVTGNT